MGTKLYVGNLTEDTTDHDLRAMFEPYGRVRSAEVVMARGNRRCKGFGFVELETSQQAAAAIEALHGQDVGGNELIVMVSQPKQDMGGTAGSNYRGGGTGGRRHAPIEPRDPSRHRSW